MLPKTSHKEKSLKSLMGGNVEKKCPLRRKKNVKKFNWEDLLRFGQI